MENQTIQSKSEILFLYESTYSIPNGDPFTGEQRYDEETKRILISDVRIKRFIRDYLSDHDHEIYVISDLTSVSENGKESGAAARMKSLKSKKENSGLDAKSILRQCIDVRLFGGISTEKKDAVNLTGPVQFALLNPSLNEVELRMHQNTSVFASSVEKTRGAIGTTTVVPYSVNQIHGWINPYTAKHSGLSDTDVDLMFKALWESINIVNTRTKSNQNSLLLLQIIYTEPNKKLYGLDRLIRINCKDDRRGEQLRSLEDFDFDFSGIFEAAQSEVVNKLRYYSALPKLNDQFRGKSKFEGMQL